MNQILVLLYHRVISLDPDLHMLAVNPDNFYQQIKYLKSNYNIISLKESFNSITKPSIVITFDDGYADNFNNALPILEDLQVPATIFVSTETIDTSREFWWDELERLLLIGDYFPDSFNLNDKIFSCEWNTKTYAKRKILYYTLHWLMRCQIDTATRENWFEQLRKWRGISADGRKHNYALTSSECKELSCSKYIDIGAHTIHHPSLAAYTKEKQFEEIMQSKLSLESIIEKEVNLFSYPFGTKGDFNANTISICNEVGFQKAVANIPGTWHEQIGLYEIPRNIVRDWEISCFIDTIEKLFRN